MTRSRRRPGQGGEKSGWGEQVEGVQAVTHALTARRREIGDVYLSRSDDRAASSIEKLASSAGARFHRVEKRELDAMALTAAPQGVVAKGEPLPEVALSDAADRAFQSRAFIIAVDGVVDPQNLGAIMRSAEAAGASAALLPSRRAAPLSATALKAAAGAAEHLDLVPITSVAKALAATKKRGLWTVVLESGGDPIYSAELLTDPLVLVVGSEGQGVSRLVRERADLIATIPLQGAVESLNASAATAAACSEIVRLRRLEGR